MSRVSTEEPPLPIGYYEDPARRCTFTLEKSSSDYKGLAFAIFLRAIEDGCNPDWLKQLADFYEIRVPLEILDRTPNTRVKMNQRLSSFVSIETVRVCRAPLLSWEDGYRINTPFLAPK
jgi:hypothetical protein